MTKEIVFHLGDPKTGSTAIQETLATGAFSSPGRRVLYPARLHHMQLAQSFYKAGKKTQKAEQMQRLAQAVKASNADVAIVSAEAFSHVEPEDLKAAIDQWLPDYAGRIRLIAYVRPHAERLLSGFAERTKQGVFGGTLEELHEVLLKKGLLRYAPRFERWRAAFGDAFELRPLIRDRLKDRDVVTDFLDFALSGAPVELKPRPQSNESLTLQDLAILREFHRAARARGADRGVCTAFGWHFAKTLSATPPPDQGERLRLHRALAEKVIAGYRDDARALDATFFDDTPMQDALAACRERAREQPHSIEPEEVLDPDRLRLARVWAEMMLVQIEEDPEGFGRRLRHNETRTLGLKPPQAAAAAPAAAPQPRLLHRLSRRAGRVVGRLTP